MLKISVLFIITIMFLFLTFFLDHQLDEAWARIPAILTVGFICGVNAAFFILAIMELSNNNERKVK